jgi:hypothetical protein
MLKQKTINKITLPFAGITQCTDQYMATSVNKQCSEFRPHAPVTRWNLSSEPRLKSTEMSPEKPVRPE